MSKPKYFYVRWDHAKGKPDTFGDTLEKLFVPLGYRWDCTFNDEDELTLKFVQSPEDSLPIGLRLANNLPDVDMFEPTKDAMRKRNDLLESIVAAYLQNGGNIEDIQLVEEHIHDESGIRIHWYIQKR